MSVIPASAASPAIPDEDDLTGLEDLEPSDLVMPRLTIDHSEGVFVDSLSGEKSAELDVILLGLIKQRILWPAEIGDDGDPPLCRSYNFREGRPSDDFPWGASGFDASAAEADGTGQLVLPCGSCPLKDWGSHPKNDTPWCSEQHTFPLLIDGTAPALLTVQRTAIKPSKAYLSSFARTKTPLYTVVTKIKLDARKRGTNRYAVPMFSKVGDSDRELWGEFAEQYRSIRGFVQTPRVRDDESESSSSSAAARPTSTPAPAPAPAAGAVDDEDDLPF